MKKTSVRESEHGCRRVSQCLRLQPKCYLGSIRPISRCKRECAWGSTGLADSTGLTRAACWAFGFVESDQRRPGVAS